MSFHYGSKRNLYFLSIKHNIELIEIEYEINKNIRVYGKISMRMLRNCLSSKKTFDEGLLESLAYTPRGCQVQHQSYLILLSLVIPEMLYQ